MSLMSAAEGFSGLDRSAIALDASQCTHSHDQFSTCEACFEICPVGAIQPGAPPSLEEEKCQSCLACLPACPVDAFTANDGVQSLLTCVARLDTKALELVCARHEDAETGISSELPGVRVRGCLAGLGAGTYLALAALGLERIALRLDACENCSWAPLKKSIHHQVDQAGALFAHWELGETIVCIETLDKRAERPLWDAANPPLSRRDLFLLAAQGGPVAMARAMSEDRSGDERHPGRDRSRITAAMAHLPKPTATLDAPLERGISLSLLVSGACTACGSCARACPTAALKLSHNVEKTRYRLAFSPQACVACEACLHVCAPEAIEANAAPTFGQVFGSPEPLVLSEGDVSRCTQCKTYFASSPGQTLCPVCDFRRKHPFGSMLPPGVKATAVKPRGQVTHDS